jgi:hypothetical protein
MALNDSTWAPLREAVPSFRERWAEITGWDWYDPALEGLKNRGPRGASRRARCPGRLDRVRRLLRRARTPLRRTVRRGRGVPSHSRAAVGSDTCSRGPPRRVVSPLQASGPALPRTLACRLRAHSRRPGLRCSTCCLTIVAIPNSPCLSRVRAASNEKLKPTATPSSLVEYFIRSAAA